MKDVLKINFNASSNWFEDKNFQEEEIWERKHMLDTTQHMCCILYAHWEKSNLCRVAPTSKNLTEGEWAMIHTILAKYELIFDGKLGDWKKPYI